MSRLDRYIAERYPWLTRTRAVAGAFAIVLLIVAIWPHAHVVGEFVIATAIPGSIGAVGWALTYWSRARVEIGRRQLRYKSVRRIAGIATLACLPFLLTQQASIYLRTPRANVSASPVSYANPSDVRFRMVVAIAHLEGDAGKRIEGRLVAALAGLDPRLKVTPAILDRVIAVSGRPQGIAHLDALEMVTDARIASLIWGGTNGASNPAIGPLYATRFGNDMQFGGAYLPADFKLPELPVDDLCTVLRLMVATQSAESMQQFNYKFGDALEPLIKQVRALADDPAKTSGWSADTRARVNLIIGLALTLSGAELESADSLQTAVSYFQRTQPDWTREGYPLEWAMAQQNLGLAQRTLADQNDELAHLNAAAAAYQNALALYESRSDRIDSANMQYGLGLTYQRIGGEQTDSQNMHKAADYYRAALKGFDPAYYPNSWGEDQLNLGNTLRVLAHEDANPKEYDEAIAADREALKVFDRNSRSRSWAAAEGQLAQSLADLGSETSNRDDIKQSITLFGEVLDGYDRERDPEEWAELQLGLGAALWNLYDLNPDAGSEYLQPAVKAFRASLEVLTPEHQPTDWANAKNGLGTSLGGLGKSTNDSDYFEQSIEAFKDTLKVYRRDEQPVNWAQAKYDIGLVLLDLGDQGSGVRYLEEALDNFNQALTVLSKDKSPELWGEVQEGLKDATDDLHQRGWKGS
jgi:tetratricopeptide (TPR) repeat protein